MVVVFVTSAVVVVVIVVALSGKVTSVSTTEPVSVVTFPSSDTFISEEYCPFLFVSPAISLAMSSTVSVFLSETSTVSSEEVSVVVVVVVIVVS